MTESEVRQIVMDVIGRRDNTLANGVVAHIDGGRQVQAGHQGVNGQAVDGGGIWGFTSSSSQIPGPFEMELEGTSATFTNCVYQRMFVWHELDDLTGTVAATGDVWVGVEIDESDGTGTIITGASLDDVADTSVPADQSQFKIPLYKITNGGVVCDYRKAPFMGAYV